jgi:hypothetical protein
MGKEGRVGGREEGKRKGERRNGDEIMKDNLAI